MIPSSFLSSFFATWQALRDPLDGDELFAVVAVPQSCPRWVRVGPTSPATDEQFTFIAVEDLIKANLRFLFGGMEVRMVGFSPLRISSLDTSDSVRLSVRFHVLPPHASNEGGGST